MSLPDHGDWAGVEVDEDPCSQLGSEVNDDLSLIALRSPGTRRASVMGDGDDYVPR